MGTPFAYQKAAPLISRAPKSSQKAGGSRAGTLAAEAASPARCARGCCAEGTWAVLGPRAGSGEPQPRALGWQ